MLRKKQEEGRYRVLLLGLGNKREDEKEAFCREVSERYKIPVAHLRKIVERSPLILKKNLTLKQAESLGKLLRSFGAMVSVEEKRESLETLLEFQELASPQVALESSFLRRTVGGAWNVIGRVRNISPGSLADSWVLIQLFDSLEEILTFEEVPISINPLPPGMASPFKAVFEGDLSIGKVSIAFKTSSGRPLPAVDNRKKREWVEIRMDDRGSTSLASLSVPSGNEKISETAEQRGPADEILLEEILDLRHRSQAVEAEVYPVQIEELQRADREGGEGNLEDRPSSSLEASWKEALDLRDHPSSLELGAFEDHRDRSEEGLQDMFDSQPSPDLPLPLSGIEEKEAGTVPSEPEVPLPDHPEENEEDHVETSPFDEASQLLREISEKTPPKGTTLPPPWIDGFRNSIETYYRQNSDLFSAWFKERKEESGFTDSFHSLLTVLVHARFDQGGQPENALENTHRVYGLLLRSNLDLEEIPSLEGTEFFAQENWRYLFQRALPKLRQVAADILERRTWTASDLERLIQIIPHMSLQNSRGATRRIHTLIPEAVAIDFSKFPVAVGENLYRVSSRLGVVDPHVDFYQGKNSIGDLKIQSFAKATYPGDPVKIEEPMNWLGRREEGHCLAVDPRCDGCLFESFCPKLYTDFNPSAEGMKER